MKHVNDRSRNTVGERVRLVLAGMVAAVVAAAIGVSVLPSDAGAAQRSATVTPAAAVMTVTQPVAQRTAPRAVITRRAEASGVVAVHNGRFGYQEIVFGKASTRRIAGTSAFSLASLLVSITGYGVPLAVMLYMYQFRAQDAVNLGQCFALVRPVWGSGYFPARTSWDCR